jgi:hypothetical protein
MGLFSTSAAERARKAAISAKNTQRDLEYASVLLREMEHLLRKLHDELPPQVPDKIIKNIQLNMTMTERHADRTLIHMKRLRDHIKSLEDHMRNARHK